MKTKIFLRILLFASLGALLWTAHKKGDLPAFERIFPRMTDSNISQPSSTALKPSIYQTLPAQLPQKFHALLEAIVSPSPILTNPKIFSDFLTSQGINFSVETRGEQVLNSKVITFKGLTQPIQKSTFTGAIFSEKIKNSYELVFAHFSLNAIESVETTNLVSHLILENQWQKKFQDNHILEFENKSGHIIQIVNSEAKEVRKISSLSVIFQTGVIKSADVAKLTRELSGSDK